VKTYPDLVVCEHCDSIHHRRDLNRRELARCTTCKAVLYRASGLDVDRWLAMTFAAAILFVIANTQPVILISFHGLHNATTLSQAAAALASGPIALIAIPTALTIILVPLAQILTLGWVLLFARFGQRSPGFPMAMRLLRRLRPWSMLEVAILGILVAVIKLASLVDVRPGAGLWAMAGLVVLITIIANRDTEWLWDLTGPKTTDLGADG
jgi:paraquat-inducible protein A